MTSSDETYVLEVLAGKYEGGEYELEEGNEIVVGRSSELDMVLVEDMVSRRHAKISVEDGRVLIEDFGSTNGTFVNGEQIRDAELAVGDRILIGTNIMKLVRASRDESLNDLSSDQPDGEQSDPTPQSARRTGGATLTGSISGRVEEVPLPDLFQLFVSNSKSGILVVRTDDDVGRVHLDEGRVYDATINEDDDVSPRKAFFRILGWQKGEFHLEKSPDDQPDTGMLEPLGELLEEGLRQLDQIRSLGTDVPGYHETVVVRKPLVPPLRSLSDDLLDTFQLAFNYGKVVTILNKSLGDDFETMQDIVHLLRKDYLEVESS